MRTIEPLGDEAEILRESQVDPRGEMVPRQVNSGTPLSEAPVPGDAIAVTPPTPLPEAPAPVAPARRRHWWLPSLAIATVGGNLFLILNLLVLPSDTNMLLAGKQLFSMPVSGDPSPLSNPVDYLTMALAIAQLALALFIVKFRWARVAMVYALIAALCLSIRVWVVSVAMPEGAMLWQVLNPLYLAMVTLFGGIFIVPKLLACYIIPLALLITLLIAPFKKRNDAMIFEQRRSRQSEASA